MQEWQHEYPLLKDIERAEEVFWLNSEYLPAEDALQSVPFSRQDVVDVEKRLVRFAPYIRDAFPETSNHGGLIESPLQPIPTMQEMMARDFNRSIPGTMLLKCDSELAISGSVKARGGIYEVLKIAEKLALDAGMLNRDADYSVLGKPYFREFFSHYRIAVGSTGNLGLSIGIIGAKMGFHVSVHMSMDAKEWKKDKLRRLGVQVEEHASDYTAAVEKGRQEAERSENMFFIDDENSSDLFLGYAVAASRLHHQLEKLQVPVTPERPLVVYLPCGVGGGPGGIAFGLKLLYGDNVHVYFAEPTHSPSMLLGLLTRKHDAVCVQDFGLDNKTAADGLAVARPSRFVGHVMEHLIDGVYTVADEKLYKLLSMLTDAENIAVEPSAAAGLYGPVMLTGSDILNPGQRQNLNLQTLSGSTHLIWATGGGMVPEAVMSADYEKGTSLRS